MYVFEINTSCWIFTINIREGDIAAGVMARFMSSWEGKN